MCVRPDRKQHMAFGVTEFDPGLTVCVSRHVHCAGNFIMTPGSWATAPTRCIPCRMGGTDRAVTVSVYHLPPVHAAPVPLVPGARGPVWTLDRGQGIWATCISTASVMGGVRRLYCIGAINCPNPSSERHGGQNPCSTQSNPSAIPPPLTHTGEMVRGCTHAQFLQASIFTGSKK
jgi:hypothetical protein